MGRSLEDRSRLDGAGVVACRVVLCSKSYFFFRGVLSERT